MQNSLRWEKGVFSDTYRIYSNDQQIGIMKNKSFSQSAIGEINGKSYTFKTKGFFKQHTEIFDNIDNSVMGEITYNNWITKAFLSIRNKRRTWKYDNIWNTKWSICNSERVEIKYAGSSTGGQIDSNTEDDLLLLTGLYVTNYYWQMTVAILVAVLIPIWVSSTN